MKYYNLRSIIAAGKRTFNMRTSSEWFCVAQQRKRPYIEPTFAKELFDTERPAVMLISAVGATGKSTLAEVLSCQTGLPLLDLSKYKPVGANTLIGLLTSSFGVEDLSNVFRAIGEGTYGIIIDGVDEGRAKTTQAAFEAFLDDIVQMCPCPANTSIVLLGRTQTVDDCWLYLASKGMTPGLITISSFELGQAREYIDSFTERLPQYEPQYREARDTILAKLGAAFEVSADNTGENFLSFIGYPPVLDAIVTLLQKGQNYHKLLTDIGADFADVEISLLNRIAQYILRREKEQKVVPNIFEVLAGVLPDHVKEEIRQSAYGFEEQCIRLVSFCLDRPLRLRRISDPSINEKYETVLTTCLREHPFLHGRQFRNAVFESVALVTLMSSHDPLCHDLVVLYARSHKHSYHLVYLLSASAPEGYVAIQYLEILLGSALEFRSRTSSVELHVSAPESDDLLSDTRGETAIDIDIEILLGKNKDKTRTFSFNSTLANTSQINLGCRLSATYVSVPCQVILSGSQELDFTAPVEVIADKIVLQAKGLILRCADQQDESQNYVLLEAMSAQSTLENITTNGVTLALAVSDRSGLAYPIIQYADKRQQLPADPQFRVKYLRLRRILSELRSHGRGGLARVKDKIEDDRVLKGKTGQAVLRQLVSDGVLTRVGDFYHLDSKEFDKHLCISWPDLRMHHLSDQLVRYLRAIP